LKGAKAHPVFFEQIHELIEQLIEFFDVVVGLKETEELVVAAIAEKLAKVVVTYGCDGC